MFSDLTSFAMVRTGKQALGFYLVYLSIAIVLAYIAGELGGLGADAGPSSLDLIIGIKWGTVTAVIYVLLIGMTIVVSKKLGIGYIFLALLGGVLALLGGGLLGLIPAALLTTRPEPIRIAIDSE